MDTEDFAITQRINEDGSKAFVGGGFVLNSSIYGVESPSMRTIESSDEQNGGDSEQVSSVFKNLAVPAGLFCPHRTTIIPSYTSHDKVGHDMLSDDIYDKLFGLIQASKSGRVRRDTKKRAHKRVLGKKSRRKSA